MIHDLGAGGAEKVLVNLVNGLDKSVFDVTVLALFGGGVNEQYLDSAVRYKTAFSKAFPANSKLMKLFSPQYWHKRLICEKYDIEISFLEGPAARVVSGCQCGQTKTISWIHSKQENRRAAVSSFRGYAEAELCYGGFDRTICVSEGVKHFFISQFPKVKFADVLYNVNNTEYIRNSALEETPDCLISPGEFNIIGIGKLEDNKGFLRLLHAHEELRNRGYPVHTRILGTGSLRKTLQDTIREKNMQESFELLGYQTNPYKYLYRSDLFVCSSYSEGFSTATTEALVLGIPCVSTPVSGADELLGKANEFGIVTDGSDEGLFEAIRQMASDEGIYLKYKKAASARGDEFSSSRSIKAIEDYLINLIQ